MTLHICKPKTIGVETGRSGAHWTAQRSLGKKQKTTKKDSRVLWTTSKWLRADWSSLGARRARLQLGSWGTAAMAGWGSPTLSTEPSPAQQVPKEHSVSGESSHLLVTLHRADQSQNSVVTQLKARPGLLHAKQPTLRQPQ